MPQILNYVNIEVIDGVNYVINAADNSLEYYINGTEALTSNWAVTMGAGSVAGMQLHMKYGAVVTLAGNHIFILGTQIPDGLADKNFDVFGFYNGSAWEISFLPDFQDANIIGTDNLLDDCVTNDKLAKMLRGTVKVGGVSDAPTDLVSSVSGNILIGDGTDIKSLAVTGDVGITGAGLTTIVADAVDNTKLANMVRGTVKVGGVANAPTDLVASTSAQILIGNGTDLISVPVTGDVTIAATGVTTINPSVIPESIWELGSGTLSAQTIGTTCNSSGNYSIAEGFATTSSGNFSHAEGAGTTSSGVDSHAEGYLSVASGIAAHAEGTNNLASGQNSHAEGGNTKSSGIYSHAEGLESVAHIHSSSAFSSGRFTINGDCEELKLFLKKVTTNAVAANMLLGDGATAGIEIPTDCVVDFDCRYVALQTAAVTPGADGNPNDCVTQKITFSVANHAGTLTMLTQGIATTATIVTKASNIIYYEQAEYHANTLLAPTLIPAISGTKVLFNATGEANKTIQHSCLVNMVINGYNNFSI